MAIDLSQYKIDPSPIDLSKYKMGGAPAPTGQAAQAQPASLPGKLLKGAGDLYNNFSAGATNFANAAASSFIKQGAKVLDTVNYPFRAATNAISPGNGIQEIATPEFNQTVDKVLGTPQGAGGVAGDIYAKTVPYLFGSEAVAPITSWIAKGTEALPWVYQTGLRLLGNAITEGVSAGLTTKATTGDTDQALNVGTTVGVLSGLGTGVTQSLKGMGIPEKLYGMFFKDTKNDIKNMWNSQWASDLQKSDPQKYLDFVKKGVIRTVPGGAPIVNQTLAQKALMDGVSGSVDSMGTYVTGKLKTFEDATQTAVGQIKETVDLSGAPNLKSTLLELAQDHEGVGLDNTMSDKMLSLAGKLDKGEPLSAEDTLDIRRALDKSRSFPDTPFSKKSLSQQNLKSLSDYVRVEFNKLPMPVGSQYKTMGELMDDYSNHMDYLKSLVTKAKQMNNKALITNLESAITTFGLLSGNPVLEVAPAALRFATGAKFATSLAQKIVSPPTIGGITTRAVAGAVANPPTSTTQ